jgi:hypothetical protein
MQDLSVWTSRAKSILSILEHFVANYNELFNSGGAFTFQLMITRSGTYQLRKTILSPKI